MEFEAHSLPSTVIEPVVSRENMGISCLSDSDHPKSVE